MLRKARKGGVSGNKETVKNAAAAVVDHVSNAQPSAASDPSRRKKVTATSAARSRARAQALAARSAKLPAGGRNQLQYLQALHQVHQDQELEGGGPIFSMQDAAYAAAHEQQQSQAHQHLLQQRQSYLIQQQHQHQHQHQYQQWHQHVSQDLQQQDQQHMLQHHHQQYPQLHQSGQYDQQVLASDQPYLALTPIESENGMVFMQHGQIFQGGQPECILLPDGQVVYASPLQQQYAHGQPIDLSADDDDDEHYVAPQTPQSRRSLDPGYTSHILTPEGIPIVGLGINMGAGHVQPIHLTPQSLPQDFTLHQAHSASDVAHHSGAGGLFVSPDLTSDLIEGQVRCLSRNSQASNQSVLSAPPDMQHSTYHPHVIYQQRIQQGLHTPQIAQLDGNHQGLPSTPIRAPKTARQSSMYQTLSTPVSPSLLPESLSKPFSDASLDVDFDTSYTFKVKEEESSYPLYPVSVTGTPASVSFPVVAKSASPTLRTSHDNDVEKFVSPASISPAMSTHSFPNRARAHTLVDNVDVPTMTIDYAEPSLTAQIQPDAKEAQHLHPSYAMTTPGQAHIGYSTTSTPIYPTPPMSSQAQFTAQFSDANSLYTAPVQTNAPRMFLSASHSGVPASSQADMQTSYVSNYAAAPSLVPIPHGHSYPSSSYSYSPSPPLLNAQPGAFNDNTAPAFQHMAPSKSHTNTRSYLQAPVLSRSYSSPVVPQRVMSMPNTPMIRQTSTFADTVGLYTSFDDESIGKSSQFMGVGTTNDLMTEA